MSETLPARRPDGTFPEGVSGNPAGRPRGSKNHITQLKQQLEIAVRDNINPREVRKVLDRMMDLAIEGNVGAAKLVLDKVLSNAKDAEDDGGGQGKIVFEVKNLTLKHDSSEPQNIIDVTPHTGEDACLQVDSEAIRTASTSQVEPSS